MKKIALTTIFIWLLLRLSAQDHHCAFDSTDAYRNRQNPYNRQNLKAFMLDAKKLAATLPKNIPNAKRSSPYNPGFADYVIPVVVHVIHSGGVTNISDAQIENQISAVNKYYQPYGIQFCLATMMPDGTPFSGITRRQDALCKYRLNLDEAALMSLDLFPRDKYLNIWVVDTILDDNGKDLGQIGSGSYPDQRKLGVVIRHDFFGDFTSCGSCQLNTKARGKALVHELGHFFGLLHTHEGNCSGTDQYSCDTAGDFICDTPPMKHVDFKCRDTITCTNQSPSLRNDPIHNYMSYKDEDCLTEFTPQQLEVIRANIEFYLETLIDPDNIASVGGNACGYVTALFNASNTLICGSGSVTFTALDDSANHIYNWIIKKSNGSLLSSFAGSSNTRTQNFTVADNYTVTLEVTSSYGTAKRTRTAYIQVINCGNTINSTRGNWYFGNYAGLEFKQFAAIPDKKSYDGNKGLTEQNLNSFEGCIVQNNKFGQLMFYGGGKQIGSTDDQFYIYDRNHDEMPNSPVKGTSTSAYGGVVVPVPGSGKRFYLFTTNNQNYSSSDDYGCRWSIIDSSLNSNNGDIDPSFKNKPLKAAPGRFFNPLDSAAYTGEGICAIPGCDSSSYWLIVNAVRYDVHFIGDSTLVSRYIEIYKITASGIAHYNQYVHPEYFSAYGSIVASPDGRYVSDCGLLFLFNRKTGSLRLLNNLQDKDGSNKPLKDFYHARFSPNSKILYILRHIEIDALQGLYSKELRQYDLTTDGTFASKTPLKDNAYSLQNGPDNRMYISQFNDPFMSYISSPNTLNGFVSTRNFDLQSDKIHLKLGLITMRSMGGLPNFIDADRQIDVAKKIYHRITSCNKVYFYTNQCCATSYSWNFGDGNTASTDTAWHQYAGKTDTFFITLVADGITLYDTVRFGFKGTAIDGDTAICDTSNFNIYYAHNAKPDIYKYQWSTVNGFIRSNSSLTYAETKWSAPGSVKLILTDKFGCKDTAIRASAFASKIQGNTITGPSACSIDSLIGSTPTGGNGRFRYMWQFKKKGESGWTELDTFKSMLPSALGGTRIFRRVVFSGGCLSYSNELTVVSLGDLNKIQKFVVDSVGGRCYTKLIGDEDIGQYYPGATYQWQESTNQITWTNTSGQTNYIMTVNLDTTVKYFRLRVTYSTCTSFSNVLQGNLLIIEKRPVDFEYCPTADSFPAYFDFKIKTYNLNSFNIQWFRKHVGPNKPWMAIGNLLSDADTQLFISKNIDTNNIVNGDSFRFEITNIGCGVNNKAYSNIVIFKRIDSLKILVQPHDTTVNAGANVRLRFMVNVPDKCTYTWQASKDTINWQDLPNTDNDTLFRNSVNECQDSMYYRAVIHHPCKVKYTRAALVIVNSTSSTAWDLWMKDRWSDNGTEPGDSSDWAQSVDLWIRNKKDGIKPRAAAQQQIAANYDTNWVYAMVRNKGSVNNPSGTGMLYLYWTWASTGEVWDRAWTYNNNNVYSNGKPMGGQINRTPYSIPSIGHPDSLKIPFGWTDFPRPEWYGLSKSDKINVCLLARIQTCEEPKYGMTFKEKTDLKYNVNRNNNIVTRNTWVKYLLKPGWTKDNSETGTRGGSSGTETGQGMMIGGGFTPGNGQTEFSLRPEISDGGMVLVNNPNSYPATYKVCIAATSGTYFTKADAYVELSVNLADAAVGATFTGLELVEGNIYKITSTSACISGLELYEDFEGAINYYFAYKDVNDHFSAAELYVFSVKQYDANNREIGHCWFNIADNPFIPLRTTETNESVTVCDWTLSGAEATYTVPFPDLPYTIYYQQGTDYIETNGTGTYSLEAGDYIITTQDGESNEIFITNLSVSTQYPSNSNEIDTVYYDCGSPDEVEYTTDCLDGVMLDINSNPVTPDYPGHYTLDPQQPSYTFYCADSANCINRTITIIFKDRVTVPANNYNYFHGSYDRSEDPCCFVILDGSICDGGATSVVFGQELQIYDMTPAYLYTTSVDMMGSSLGFRFCPPQWNTDAFLINNSYSIVFRNDPCSFCRADFQCDSTGEHEEFKIIPGRIMTNGTNQSKFSSDSVFKIKSKKPLIGGGQTSLSVRPNPAASEVNITVLNANNAILSVIIYDAAGKPVYSERFNTENNGLKTKIELTEFESGVYSVYIPELNYYYKLVIIK